MNKSTIDNLISEVRAHEKAKKISEIYSEMDSLRVSRRVRRYIELEKQLKELENEEIQS